MDPENKKKNSDNSQADSENNSNEMSTDINSGMQEPERKNKPKWDDREIDFDQLIF